jgi:hypothetical protein
MFLRSEDRRLAAWALCLRAQEAQNYRSAEQWTDLISNHDFVTRKNDRMRATGRSAALHDKRLTLVTRARARAFQTKKIEKIVQFDYFDVRLRYCLNIIYLCGISFVIVRPNDVSELLDDGLGRNGRTCEIEEAEGHN